ncbi:MAG: hypothetical protein Q9197_001225 [Variospora fuerteventurae]
MASSSLLSTSFCRAARSSSMLSDSVTCISEKCTAGGPFSPAPLLDLFKEDCQVPISPNILNKVKRLAAQRLAPSPDPVSSTSVQSNAGEASTSEAAVKSSVTPKEVTTTYIGIATNAEGQQETFTVPALLVATGTVYGRPVTEVQGPPPTSTIALPWPTLPVGYFSLSQPAPGTTAPVQALGPVTTPSTGSAAARTSSGQRSPQGGDIEDGGTILDTNDGPKHGAASSLRLTVVLVVGVLWF